MEIVDVVVFWLVCGLLFLLFLGSTTKRDRTTKL